MGGGLIQNDFTISTDNIFQYGFKPSFKSFHKILKIY
jgi:hypothetical protein